MEQQPALARKAPCKPTCGLVWPKLRTLGRWEAFPAVMGYFCGVLGRNLFLSRLKGYQQPIWLLENISPQQRAEGRIHKGFWDNGNF